MRRFAETGFSFWTNSHKCRESNQPALGHNKDPMQGSFLLLRVSTTVVLTLNRRKDMRETRVEWTELNWPLITCV